MWNWPNWPINYGVTCDGRTVTQNVYGKGRVIWWKSAKDILATSGILPDFECYGDGPQDTLDYIHRIVGDIDIYFISNPSNQAKYYQCTFRVDNKAPELWSPDTGEISHRMLYDLPERQPRLRCRYISSRMVPRL